MFGDVATISFMWAMKNLNPGWLGYIGDDISYRVFVGINYFINHEIIIPF